MPYLQSEPIILVSQCDENAVFTSDEYFMVDRARVFSAKNCPVVKCEIFFRQNEAGMVVAAAASALWMRVGRDT